MVNSCAKRIIPLVILLLAGSTTLAVAGIVYNATDQFDASSNPTSSGWSYGWKATPTGIFNVFSNSCWECYDDGYYGWNTGPTYPEVNRSPSGLEFTPLSVADLAGVRWTSSVSGWASLSSTFQGYWGGDNGLYTNAGGYVLFNTALLYEGDIYSHGSVGYNGSFAVSPGDTIDFLVGKDSKGVMEYGRTIATAQIEITSIPEPATLVMLGPLLVLTGLRRIRIRRFCGII